jgi:hypothetical protein
MTDNEFTRRQLLQYSLAAPAVWGAVQWVGRSARAVDFTQPVPEADQLSAYHKGGLVLIRWNNQVLAGYRADSMQKYPYFSPLSGPVSGLSLTTESALPYPHHRGLWLGCEPLNGGDYWSDGPLKTGQIRSMALALGETTPTSVVITNRCQWVRPDAPSPWQDERTFKISVPNERIRLLDVEFKLTANEDVAIKRAKHSFFALRCAPDLAPMYGGTLMNSEGDVGAEGTFGKPAAWCGYHGRRVQRPDIVEGIAIMDHPQNPWTPCPWFTRDYGHLSPSPFNFSETPWQLPAGESITLKYRVVLHAGDPAEAELDNLYKEWTKR